ncbi:SPOR domain-containing protein [Rhodocytophaga aerolata]|uniref:SPOR domain-containing protein n=1 Tax=Rhodocytophaga aerolata TaxID=455078 RepID=A0ABT8QYT1_9BACT|nr:SPOR domain-containing protein [Rhodocytophaga aerolata]MDO1444829.1 SPOR domain-containing protein [Rhodocytophaga aerolata]
MVEKHIKNLLFEYDCVVIPEFGGFIANYVSAEIHPVTHTFLPPSKHIAFNEMLKLNDGLLTSQIASSENMSREDALQVIRDFINQVKTEIGQKDKYVFNEIGTLYLNHEQKLQFEPDTTINYLSGSFGLPKLEYKPIERVATHNKFKTKDRAAMVHDENYSDEEEGVFYPEQPRRSRTRLLLAIVVPGLLLLAGGAGYFLFLGDGRNALSSFDPFLALKTNIEAEKPATTEEPIDDSFLYADTTLAQSQEATALTEPLSEDVTTSEPEATTATDVTTEEWSTASASPEPAPTEVREISKPAKKEIAESPVIVEKTAESNESVATPSTPARYYVIIGGFSVEKNAYKLRNQLVAKGNTGARVIMPKMAGNLMKVSYTDFDTFNAAAEKAQELKAEYGNSVWVFKY